ncbi:MAG: hypothetical protein ACE5OZ_15385 [Candidatus Heimdallarchaeota archaeon]
MPKTSVLSIRIDRETRNLLETHSRTLRIRPSVLATMILRDSIEDWVRDYAKKIYHELVQQEEETERG